MTDGAPRDATSFVHLISRPDWDAAVRAGQVRAPSLATEGFIHCCTIDQLCVTAGRHYPAADDLLAVELDPALLDAEVRWAESHPGEWFPHVYGPLPVAAVTVVADLPRSPDGTFTLPPSLRG